MAAKKKVTPTQRVEVEELNLKTIKVNIQGTSPLIVHRWSEKAKKEMLDKQMKKAKQAKEAKDPEQDYRESAYSLNGKYDKKNWGKAGFGFPAVGFKNSMVTAVTSAGNMTKVAARQAFFIEGDLIKINGKPTMREDMVRLQMNTADIRFRCCFEKWDAEIPVSYNANVVSADQIVNLMALAGFGVGVGDWRPEKNGQCGRFKPV